MSEKVPQTYETDLEFLGDVNVVKNQCKVSSTQSLSFEVKDETRMLKWLKKLIGGKSHANFVLIEVHAKYTARGANIDDVKRFAVVAFKTDRINYYNPKVTELREKITNIRKVKKSTDDLSNGLYRIKKVG